MPESEDDDGDFDPEGPDPSEMDDPDAPDVIACPECGKDVAEDAQWCHHCGRHLMERDLEGKSPLVYLGLGLLVLVIVVVFVLRG